MVWQCDDVDGMTTWCCWWYDSVTVLMVWNRCCWWYDSVIVLMTWHPDVVDGMALWCCWWYGSLMLLMVWLSDVVDGMAPWWCWWYDSLMSQYLVTKASLTCEQCRPPPGEQQNIRHSWAVGWPAWRGPPPGACWPRPSAPPPAAPSDPGSPPAPRPPVQG